MWIRPSVVAYVLRIYRAHLGNALFVCVCVHFCDYSLIRNNMREMFKKVRHLITLMARISLHMVCVSTTAACSSCDTQIFPQHFSSIFFTTRGTSQGNKASLIAVLFDVQLVWPLAVMSAV